ncbi:hypothetical protein HRbin09_02080 [bacterium HR09]|nr:hypothetical protein HRbin09_02080 [bacterium HR09]
MREDRLYELSLEWRPSPSAVVQAGRLVGGPFAAMGYTDGLLAQARAWRGLWVGAFAGRVVNLGSLQGEQGTRVGGLIRVVAESTRSGAEGEFLLGAVSEKGPGGAVSRDFLSLEASWHQGGRWYVTSRGEIDVHRGWRRTLTGKTYQVTNAAFAASWQVSQQVRVSANYDQRRNYLTWDTRPLPEDVFVRYFREGGRVALDWQGPASWRVTLATGLERPGAGAQATQSFYGAVSKGRVGRLPLAFGMEANVYRGGELAGWVANLRSSFHWANGNDIGLVFGRSVVSGLASWTKPHRQNSWARVFSDVKLAPGLYLRAELEKRVGDDSGGQQALADLVIRF